MIKFERMVTKVQRQSFTLNGGTYSFQPYRDMLAAKYRIIIEANISAASATAAADGLAALVKNIQVKGTLLGKNINPFNGLNGRDIFELAQFVGGNLPKVVGSLGGTGVARLDLPLHFMQERLPYPFNMMSCIPTWLMNDFQVSVIGATQADLDTNAVPTFAITNASIYLVQEGFYTDSVPNKWAHVPFEFAVQEEPILSTGDYEIKLPAGGRYGLIALRAYASRNAAGVGLTRQVDTTAVASSVPIDTDTPGYIRLLDVGRKLKWDGDYQTLRDQNLESILDSQQDGLAVFQFNKSLNDFWDTNQLSRAQANAILNVRVRTSGNLPVIRVPYFRVFDDNQLVTPWYEAVNA